MTSLSGLAAILQAQLADAFAEIACSSARLANELLERFPAYGSAKHDLSNTFWMGDASKMLVAIQNSPAPIYEESDDGC